MLFEDGRPLWRQEEHKGKEVLLGALLVPSFLEAQSRRGSMPPPMFPKSSQSICEPGARAMADSLWLWRSHLALCHLVPIWDC